MTMTLSYWDQIINHRTTGLTRLLQDHDDQ